MLDFHLETRHFALEPLTLNRSPVILKRFRGDRQLFAHEIGQILFANLDTSQSDL